MSFHEGNTAPSPASSTALVSPQGNKGVMVPWLLPEGEIGAIPGLNVVFLRGLTLSALHRDGDGWDGSWRSPPALPHWESS